MRAHWSLTEQATHIQWSISNTKASQHQQHGQPQAAGQQPHGNDSLITNKQQQHTGSDSNSTNEYTHTHMYVYIYIVCVYIYTHIYIYIHTNAHIHVLNCPPPFPATPARLQQWKPADASAEATGTGAAESCTERGLNTLMDFPSGSSSGCHHRFVIDAPVMDAVFAGIGTASSHASFLRVVPDADARKPKYS